MAIAAITRATIITISQLAPPCRAVGRATLLRLPPGVTTAAASDTLAVTWRASLSISGAAPGCVGEKSPPAAEGSSDAVDSLGIGANQATAMNTTPEPINARMLPSWSMDPKSRKVIFNAASAIRTAPADQRLRDFDRVAHHASPAPNPAHIRETTAGKDMPRMSPAFMTRSGPHSRRSMAWMVSAAATTITTPAVLTLRGSGCSATVRAR